jgi:hypothetical protein
MDCGPTPRGGLALICEECGAEACDEARGWRGYLSEYLALAREGDLAFYCPTCALRTFGPPRFRTSRDDELKS